MTNTGSGEPTVGTLGSVFTFAGQATAALLANRGAKAVTSYLSTMDAVVEAVLDGRIDQGVLTSETSRTACTDTAARLLAGDPLFIVEEIVVPYHCALLVRPGTTLEDIRHVGGHGSLRQCQEFLRTRLPRATAQMHEQNSVVAAREVLEGDGTTAVVATEALAAELGLTILERDVDGGAAGGWWALASKLDVAGDADHVALRVEGADELNRMLAVLTVHGLVVRTITNQPSGEIFRYRYLITARTADAAPVSAQTLDSLGPAVVGAFASSTAR